MIAWLKGRCQAKDDESIVVDVCGVGYLVYMPQSEINNLVVEEQVEVLVHTVVREDSFTLFGFMTLAGREMFRAILSISGVGPKGALALLAAMTPSEIARAIHDDHPKALTVAKGIGKRTAELIVVRLRERLPPELLSEEIGKAPVTSGDWTPAMRDAKSALVNLGYRAAAAEAAVREAGTGGASGEFELLLRSALSKLRRP